MSTWELLEELRAQATTGLNFARNPYERERCERLLALAAGEYARIGALEPGEVLARFRKELGYVTTKVGVNGVLRTEQGLVLLEQRSDDACWGLPGGWVDVNETPEEAAVRELQEETGLSVRVRGLFKVASRAAGAFGQPHSSCHLIFECELLGGELMLSRESLALRYWDLAEVPQWHRDHREWLRNECDRTIG